MRELILAIVGLAAPLADSRAAATSPWEGEWVLVPAKSHLSDHSFTIKKLEGGMWLYDDGAVIYLFKADGKAYPEPLDPELSVTASIPKPGVLQLTESRSGKPIRTLIKTLSHDGSRLDSSSSDISADNRISKATKVDIREGTGVGIEGKWRELATRQSLDRAPSQKPYWVIASRKNGEMTWRIPATGEELSGRLDGQRRPAKGPGIPNSETFSWEYVSDRQIEFYYYVNGHLVERATEIMSPDQQTWTDTLWVPAYPEQKDVRVFQRR